LRVSAARSWGEQSNAEITSLFVYGGLMRGFDLHHCLGGCRFVGEGWTRGILLRAGRYPGLVDGEGTVAGDLYRMSDPAPLLATLDELEEYDPRNPQGSLYVRDVRPVSMSDGSLTFAWLYVYNRPVAGLGVIPGGDWRKAHS
jgi:gamma-glutamylcyclotransferase (GGCT)/AIG2-like uncharacterized protein YtfP